MGGPVEIPVPTRALLIAAVQGTCGCEPSAHVEPRQRAVSL
jgi:hypothetical protein